MIDMRKWKDTVANWVLSDLLEEGLIISLKILAKIIEIKFFRFVKDNGIVFNNKQEELELKRYFEKEYKKYLKQWNK